MILTGAPTFDLEIVIKPSQALLLASRAHQINFQRLGAVWVALSKEKIHFYDVVAKLKKSLPVEYDYLLENYLYWVLCIGGG